MDYKGTSNDDILNQATLGLADADNIYGGAGNDTILLARAAGSTWKS
jgi:Ca2+-binding RTX toxin-like protein